MTESTAANLDPTFADVWKTLGSIDCSEHAEDKNGLTYLSWAWAWGITMEHYPYAQYEMLPNEVLPNDTVIVWCKVTIGHLSRSMWLAVMDFKNKPVVNPTSTQIANSRMRCLTKCLSMFGLGHYIYAGEDLPSVDSDVKVEPPKKQAPKEDKVVSDGVNTFETPEAAENAATFFIETVDSMHSDSLASLADVWKKNKQLIDTFDQHFPDQYKRIKEFFTATKLKLKGE